MSGLTLGDFSSCNYNPENEFHWVSECGHRVYIIKDGTFTAIAASGRTSANNSTIHAAIRELNRLLIEEGEHTPEVKVVLTSAGYWTRPGEDGSIMTDAEGRFSVTFGDCQVNGIATFESAKWHLAKMVATGKKAY